MIYVAPLHKSQYKGEDENLLSFNRKLMCMAGIIPPENLSERPTKRMFFILYLIFWYCLFTPLYIGQILAVYHFWGDMDLTTFALIPLLGVTMTQLEGTYARIHVSSIVKLLEFLDSNVKARMEEMDVNGNYIQIIVRAKVKARRLNIIMIVLSDIMVACWIIFPITRKYLREHNTETVNMTAMQYEHRWLDFCYLIWAPFDITVTPYYEITYVCQIIVFITTTAYWKSLETTIVSLIIYTSAHLKMLEILLSEMNTLLSTNSVNKETLKKSNNKHSTKNTGPITILHTEKQLGTAELNQECLLMERMQNTRYTNEKQKLKDFIVKFVYYHEAVIELVGMVNKTFGPVMFISIFIRQLIICLALFQMAVTKVDDTFVKNLVACFAIAFSHFIFCWCGNEVIENSMLLKESAFASSLLNHSREFKHFILMIMTITQKTLGFSALGFYTLSLEQFAKLMNGAYAYFNILKDLHADQ